MRRKQPQLEPLLPVVIRPGNIRYAPGIKAGRWVFATGHKGTADFVAGMSPAVIEPRLPQSGKPRHRKEADQIFRNLDRVLEAAGTDRGHVVRIDQYYTTHKAVDPYHEARREFFAGHVPPSTSNLHQRFLLAGQDIEVQMIAVAPHVKVEQLRPPELKVHQTSGYSPALKAGDFVFVAGQTAEALEMARGPIDPEARMPAGHLWKGTPIKLETEFIIRRKMERALHAAGSSLANAVKSQVYMRDVEDHAAFNEVWRKHLGPRLPATTLITTSNPGFIVAEERIEINTIALGGGAHAKKSVVKVDVPLAYAGYSHAVRAGDLLFLSGLMAVDRNGLIPEARPDSRQPYFGSSVETQMDYILRCAERICRAAGATLANVVRIQQFHTDLNEFYPAYQAWQRHLSGAYLPFSAIEVPALAVPGAKVLLDLWIYAPG